MVFTQWVRFAALAIPEDVRNALGVVLLAFVASAIVRVVFSLVKTYLYDPLSIGRIMAKQGIEGPPFHPIFGTTAELNAYVKSVPESLPLDEDHDSMRTVSPHFHMYFPKFGKRFLYWRGPHAKLVSKDPGLAKEVLLSQYEFFQRHPQDIKMLSNFVGMGLDNLTGEKWATERRTLNPFFYHDPLKGMVEGMVKGAEPVLKSWEEEVARAGGTAEFNLEEDLHTISGNIIAHTAFGTDHEKAKEIYQTQREYVNLLFQNLHSGWYWIPGFTYLPTQTNVTMARLRSTIDSSLHELITERRKAAERGDTASYSNDLLGIMLAAASNSTDETATEFNLASVFNNAKLFFFAGQDTVATVLTFTLLQLARYPEWQDRARQEVLEEVGETEAYDSTTLNRLKIVGMIVNETMRLFPAVISVSKVATKDMQINELFIPKGLTVEIPIVSYNQDPEIWGDDVHKFKPDRFEHGVSKACKHPRAFLPFSMGPKMCIGKEFALMELKLVVAMVLRRFRLSVSPHYKHHPYSSLLTRPKYGMKLIFSSRQASKLEH